MKTPTLGDEKMKVESADSIHSDLPDISVAYKLFTQSGNMINLADWMDSFMAIKENEKKVINFFCFPLNIFIVKID